VADDAGHKIMKLERGDVVAHKFEIEKLLGGGLLGTTYLAKQLSTGKHLAVKFFHPQLVSTPKDRERLASTFRAARNIKHEGLVAYGELGDFRDTVYLTQEFAKGTSLRELMGDYGEQKKAFTLQEACQITIKVLAAVEALHNSEFIHRNLKPENIMVLTRPAGPGGKVVRTIKITDAGLADIVNPTLFSDGYIDVSKRHYIPPERGGFDQSWTPASDIYSIGVMLYELLVGQPPRGTYLSPTQLRGDLPDHIDDIVEVAIAADPEERYSTASDMRNDIQHSFQDLILAGSARTSFRNFMIGLGVALPVIGLAGLYASTLSVDESKAEAYAQAVAKDKALRHSVQVGNRQWKEAELQAITQKHKDMLFIPEGRFVMGALNQEIVTKLGRTGPIAPANEPRQVIVDQYGYYIDRYEFPNRLKQANGQPQPPVAKVTWKQAKGACEKRNKRLCTEEEWEKACKGQANTIYSYADHFDEDMCGGGAAEPHALGAKDDRCISDYGVAGLSGNVREWTSTQPGNRDKRRVVKGGSASNAEVGTRCAFKGDERVSYAHFTLGFRCCLSLPDAAD